MPYKSLFYGMVWYFTIKEVSDVFFLDAGEPNPGISG